MKTKHKAGINILIYIATVIINFLGATGRVGGNTTKEVSDRFMTVITPAPFAFSIWSVIYILLALTVIFLFAKSFEAENYKFIEKISPLFWLTSLFNIGWILSFSFLKIGLSTFMILGLFISLVILTKTIAEDEDFRDKGIYQTTFGLYTGWLSIATVVNIAAWTVSLGWDILTPKHPVTGVILLAIIAFGLIRLGLFIGNLTFFPPIGWAYVAIFAEMKTIAAFPAILVLLMGIGIFYFTFRKYKKNDNRIITA